MPGYSTSDIFIPSQDGKQVFRFDGNNGRHLATHHALTGAEILKFSYGSNGFLTGITDGDGAVTRIERDGSGKPIAIISPDGHRSSFSRDGNDRLKVTNPAGEGMSFAVNDDGKVEEMTSAMGSVTRFTYDENGRLQRAEDPVGGTLMATRTETANGYQVSSTTAQGRTSRMVSEMVGGGRRQILTQPDGSQSMTIKTPEGITSKTTADGMVSSLKAGPDPRFGMMIPVTQRFDLRTPGNLTKSLIHVRTVTLSNPANPLSMTRQTDTVTVNGQNTTSIYDAATRTFTTTSPGGRVTTRSIDTQGRTVRSKASELEETSRVYDTRGRLSQVSTGSGSAQRTTEYRYGTDGWLWQIVDSLGRLTTLNHDAVGRVVRSEGPDGAYTQYRYDLTGNLVSLIPPGRPEHRFRYTLQEQPQAYEPPAVDANNPTTTYTYDVDGALTRVDRPDGQALTLTYDAAGKLSATTAPHGTDIYAYKPGTGKLDSITGPDGTQLRYTYDGSLLTSETLSGAVQGTIGRTYDSFYRVIGLSLNGSAINFSYDADSLLTKSGSMTLARHAGNGLLTGTTLDNLTTSHGYTSFGEIATNEARYAGTPVVQLSYSRDKLGRIVDKTETLNGQTDTYHYTYSIAGRLTEVTKNGQTVESYTHDDNGNRLSQTTAQGTVTGQYDHQDRMTAYAGATYTYTANGELTSKTENGQTTHYTYDILGNLRSVLLPNGDRLDYLIDGRNRRIGKKLNGTLVQAWLYSSQLQPIAEYDGTGTLTARYVYATHGNVPDYIVKSGKNYRIIHDHLGSPRAIFDTTTNQTVQRIDYDAFGNVLSDTNPGFQPFGFAGGLYDAQTKLVRFGARDYDPIAGRWTAKDPILFEGGDTNLYGYVLADPVNLVDPLGLDTNIVTWEGVGMGRSSFGHVSTDINGTNYSFTHEGWDKTYPNSSDYYARQQKFRSGKEYHVKLTPEQEKRLGSCMNNHDPEYNMISNNCGTPVQKCLGTVGVDVGNSILPNNLGKALLKSPFTTGVRTIENHAPATK